MSVPDEMTTMFNSEKDPTKKVYRRILIEIQRIKSIDKKRWQHRSIYKSAWILLKVFENVEKSKEELLTLFNTRPTAKSLVNFWRPEFERYGSRLLHNGTDHSADLANISCTLANTSNSLLKYSNSLVILLGLEMLLVESKSAKIRSLM